MFRETITIVRSHGQFQAKRVHANGEIIAVDRTRSFDLSEEPIGDLVELGSLLNRITADYWAAAVRGAIADHTRVSGVRRLLHMDQRTGELPTLAEKPRRWVALDIDGVSLPASISVIDIDACARVAIATLPNEFRDTACIVQATASHGLKPGIRERLWFWLDRPVTGGELKTWLRAAPVDRALFSAAQLTYTAGPVFIGCRDPLPIRTAMLPGRPSVHVPSPEALAPPPRRTPPPTRFASQDEAQDCTHAALLKAARRISAAVEGERHRILIAVCCGLTPLLNAGVLAERTAREVARRAAEAAGLDDPGEIDLAISWAFSRPLESWMGAIENG